MTKHLSLGPGNEQHFFIVIDVGVLHRKHCPFAQARQKKDESPLAREWALQGFAAARTVARSTRRPTNAPAGGSVKMRQRAVRLQRRAPL
jgi:hypothetical protein